MLFGVSLALVAASALMYMVRTPSLTGTVVLGNSSMAIGIISLLILVGIVLIISSMLMTHKLQKETDAHKSALVNTLGSYLSRAREEGFSEEQILERLKEQGWKEKEIKLK